MMKLVDRIEDLFEHFAARASKRERQLLGLCPGPHRDARLEPGARASIEDEVEAMEPKHGREKRR